MSDESKDPGVKGPSYFFTELRDTGLLWLINRALLHPRGFAMSLEYDNGLDQEATGWAIVGNGTEPWQYGPSVDEDDLFAAVEALLEMHKRGKEREDAEDPKPVL